MPTGICITKYHDTTENEKELMHKICECNTFAIVRIHVQM